MKKEIVRDESSMYEVEVVFKRPVFDEMPKIDSSFAANEVIHKAVSHRSLDYKEHFWCLYLTNANRVLGYSEINIGTATGTAVNTCELFVTALKKSAVAIILVHNHPSGQLKPSNNDRDLTNKVNVFGHMIGVKLLDHLIITSEKKYFSFSDEGLLNRSQDSLPF